MKSIIIKSCALMLVFLFAPANSIAQEFQGKAYYFSKS
jgi:hypothetical protein